MTIRGRILAVAVVLGMGVSFANTPTKGELYFSIKIAAPYINKITFDFDGAKMVMGNVETKNVSQLVYGVLFTSDGNLLVSGNRDTLLKINPVTMQQLNSKTARGILTFHLSLDPSQSNCWIIDAYGSLASIPVNPFAYGTGMIPVLGDDEYLSTLTFQDANHAFYIHNILNIGAGVFGSIDMKTFTTHRMLQGIPAVAGMTYDPYTGHLLLFCMKGQIIEVDPVTGAKVDSRSFGTDEFTQGTVDGKGHMFVANKKGSLFFMDYSASKKLNDATNFTAYPVIAASLDDLTPLSGFGSKPPEIDTPLIVRHALYRDSDGNGHIDNAWIGFANAPAKPPARIQLQDPFHPGASIQVESNRIFKIDSTHFQVDFKDREFAFGTGFTTKLYGQILDDTAVFSGKTFLIGDGVGPRAILATAYPPACAGAKPKLTVVLSESVAVDIAARIFPFEILRQGPKPIGSLNVLSVLALGGNAYEYSFDTLAYPVPGDSLRIKYGAPQVADPPGNLSNMTDYIPIGGNFPIPIPIPIPKPDPVPVVHFLEIKTASLVSVGNYLSPIPLANPILLVDASQPGRCLNCPDPYITGVVSDALTKAHPGETKPLLFSISFDAPFHFQLSFFDNLGAFVNRADGDLNQTMIDGIQKDKDGKYQVGMIWWPVSASGQAVATGAYIALGVLTPSRSTEAIRKSPAIPGQMESTTIGGGKIAFTFGFLRQR